MWLVKLCRFMYLSSGSRTTYGRHHDIFIQFCSTFDIDPLLITEDELCMSIIHFSMGHTVNSVASYMSAVQNFYDGMGNGPLPRGPGFLLAYKGLKRLLRT